MKTPHRPPPPPRPASSPPLLKTSLLFFIIVSSKRPRTKNCPCKCPVLRRQIPRNMENLSQTQGPMGPPSSLGQLWDDSWCRV